MDYNLNKKTVRFDLTKNKIKVLYVYNFASEKSRNGSVWINMSIDRVRFKKRIESVEKTLSNVLSSSHRLRIYNERFFN